jgi:hypothetical protein
MKHYLRTALAERYLEELSSILGVKGKGTIVGAPAEVEANSRPISRGR